MKYLAMIGRFISRNRTMLVFAASAVVNTLLFAFQYVHLNVRIQMIEEQMRIVRVHTDSGVLCSKDGLNWYPARDDGMCHLEDAPLVRSDSPVVPSTTYLTRSEQ